MSEWKGPWKCDRCGRIWFPKPRGAIACTYECNGDLEPHDRRAPDLLALLREAREMLADEFGEPCKVLNGGSGCNHENCVLLIRIDAKLKEAGE